MTRDNVSFRYPAPGWRQRLDLYFAGMGQGMNTSALARARMGDIAALEGLSDDELARRGMRRCDIPSVVFSDILSG